MFEWRDYQELALKLVGEAESSPIREAYLRTAVSRLYYSVYRSLRSNEEQNYHYVPQSVGDHSALRRHFQTVRQKRGLAQRLFQLQIMREQCDYDDGVLNLEQMVKDARVNVEEIYKLL